MSSNSGFRIYWDVIDKTEGFSKLFAAKTYNSKIRCDYNCGNGEIEINQVLIQLETALNGMINRVLRGARPDDRIRISLRNHLLDFDVFVPFRKVREFTTEAILNEIMKISQSRRDFLLYGLIELDIIHVRMPPIGGSRSKNSIIDLDRWRTNSKKLITIKRDGLCVARSIVVSKAFVDGVKGIEWRRIRSDIRKEQYKQAMKLCEKAEVSMPANGVVYEDFAKFQMILSPDYQLIVTKPSKNFYFVVQPSADKQIFIILSENHCDVLLTS